MIEGITLYTAICGGYDHPRSDIKVFGDQPSDKFVDPVMNAKLYKVQPHQFVDSKFRIWMDGNIYPLKDPETLVKQLLDCADIAVFCHPVRRCIYEEYAAARVRLPAHQQHLIDEQVGQYKREGMPDGFGLAECGVILSRDSDLSREFFNRWWSEICRYSSRDQMSFPYVAWKMLGRIQINWLHAETRFGVEFKYVDRKLEEHPVRMTACPSSKASQLESPIPRHRPKA